MSEPRTEPTRLLRNQDVQPSEPRLRRSRMLVCIVSLLIGLVTACAPGTEPDGGEARSDDGDEPSVEREEPSVDGDEPVLDGSEEVVEPPESSEDHEPTEIDDPDLTVAVALTDVAQMAAPIAGDVGPDGTLYIAERAGTVRPVDEEGVGAAVIDVSDRTTLDGERGLLGIAFSPDGDEVYVSFTDQDGANVLAAYPLHDNVIDGDNGRDMMTIPQPYANHNGGDVQIGPDGAVYWGLGDGGGAGDPLDAGQDLSTPLGKLLRISARGGGDYEVPEDNPFVEVGDALDEIWAYGLRNPWRFSFDRATGELYIADVGQSDREEINVVAGDLAGANYGWSLREGTLEFSGEEPDDHVPPVFEYETGARCAITGGFVYRGEAIAELVGAYLYSDYCDGDIRAIVVRDGEVVDDANLGVNGGQVVSFVQDAAGELFALDLGGRVLRLDPA